MKSLKMWLEEYAESHQNSLNIAIHWCCVPLIFWSVTGFLFLITLPIVGNMAIPALFLLVLYYLSLSRTLWAGMLIFALICLWINFKLFAALGNLSGYVFAGTFVIAWIVQFYGHRVEGKKPSFLKDLQFLLIGPAWLMSKIYRKLNLPL